MSQSTLLLSLALLSLLPAATGFARSQPNDDDEPVRSIRVTGEGNSSAKPDIATIQTGVVSQAATALEAMKENNATITAMLAKLKELGIEPKDLQTSQFNVFPVYERGPRGEQKPEVAAYRVSNQVSVKVRDLGKLGQLLDQVVAAGGNQISGVRFDLDDPQEALNQARVEAVKDARARAELYAQAAGVDVGKVISISEQSIGRPEPMMRGRAMEMSAGSVPIESGEQEFTARIQVEFELLGR